MKRNEGQVTSRKTPGPTLHQITVAPDAPKAVVAIIHGYADYGARYAHVQAAWADQGIASIAIDLRGHGYAEGMRGYCEHFDEFLGDAAELEGLVKDAFPGVPAFLFGHSFGGLIAGTIGARGIGGYRGILLSNPYFELALKVSGAKVLLGKVASRFAPKLAIPAGLGGAALTHDPKVAAAYDADPLVFKKATARWFTEATRAQAEAIAGAPQMKAPLYVALGTGDVVASPNGGRAFFAAAGSTDKIKREWPELRHELLNELEWRPVADAMAEWVLERAG